MVILRTFTHKRDGIPQHHGHIHFMQPVDESLHIGDFGAAQLPVAAIVITPAVIGSLPAVVNNHRTHPHGA